ncbi:hypothetical protein CIB48_g11109 [Xylaria polymorpha]|nr:hypothetical protein CIB48_g11109 [Xylaria polymorpha]
MSGRSAYVRKKITEPKNGEKGASTGRGRSKSGSVHNTVDDGSVYDYPMPQATGFGTTNARLLKFSDPAYEGDVGNYRAELANLGNNSGGSQSGSIENERREAQGPMPDYAYARARKPVLKTEDVSGIERSGFRNAMDRRSDDIRKGLTKAFTLGLKKKKDVQLPDRAPSSATLRPHYYDADDYDNNEIPSLPTHKSCGTIRDPDYQTAIPPPPPSAKLPPVPPSTAPPIKRWIGAGRPVQRWNKLRKDPELWDPNGDVLVYFGRKDQPATPKPILPALVPHHRGHRIPISRHPATPRIYRGRLCADQLAAISHRGAAYATAQQLYTHRANDTAHLRGKRTRRRRRANLVRDVFPPHLPNLTKAETHRHAITTRTSLPSYITPLWSGYPSSRLCRISFTASTRTWSPTRTTWARSSTICRRGGSTRAQRRRDGRVDARVVRAPEVRWEEGWREAFLHCAGMYARLETCADFRHLTPITRALLERACLEMQLRVQAAEERLAGFSFVEACWGPTTNNSNTARAAAERLQQFLVGHYARTWGTWPPTESGEETWLTRTVTQRLQRDFGALYDYLVNRDVVWDESEMRSSRKWMMVSESGNKSFEADSDDLPLTDLLIEFDNRMRFPHIPHPYPLVPDSIPPPSSPSPSREKSSRKDKDKNATKAADDRTLERRIQLAYTEATNIYSLGSEFAQSDLIEGFVKFEKTDMVGVVDPFTARRGRWVLVYAILQTLASVSVDSPNARYKDGVAYHLSPRLKGTRTPPWKGVSSPAVEASHELSHCWIAPRTWHTATDSAESDASVSSSGGADPVVRMMRSRAHKFPRPPPSRASRSSHAGGWQTPSMRSSATATPTMWGGSSAMSVSNYSDDTATSSSRQMLFPAQYSHAGGYINKGLPRPPPPPPPRSRSRGNESVARSDRSTATFGPGSMNANMRSMNSSYSNGNLTALNPPSVRGDGGPQWPTRTQSMYRTQPPAPLDLSLGVTGKGDFFADMPYTPTSSKAGGGGGDGLPLSPLGSETMGPVIRDFDELDSVVEESVYENRI